MHYFDPTSYNTQRAEEFSSYKSQFQAVMKKWNKFAPTLKMNYQGSKRPHQIAIGLGGLKYKTVKDTRGMAPLHMCATVNFPMDMDPVMLRNLVNMFKNEDLTVWWTNDTAEAIQIPLFNLDKYVDQSRKEMPNYDFAPYHIIPENYLK